MNEGICQSKFLLTVRSLWQCLEKMVQTKSKRYKLKNNNTDLQDGKHCLQGDVMPPCVAFALVLIGGLFI